MSDFTTVTDHFTYVWEIKNPQYCTPTLTKSIKSPKFIVPQFWNTEWYLKLYTYGETEEDIDNASCILFRGSDTGPHTIDIKYTMSLSSDKNGYSSKDSFQEYMGYGYSNFLPQPLDAFEQSVIIMCKMEYDFCSDLFLEKMHPFSKNNSTFPMKCFAKTKIVYESKFYQGFIDSLLNGTCSKITIPVNFQEKYPSFFIDLQNNYGDIVDIKVGLVDGIITESLVVICEISIEDNVGKVLDSFEEKHTFIAGTDEVWCLTRNINKSLFKTFLSSISFNNIILKADFSTSFGKTRSKPVNVKLPKSSVSSYKYIHSNEMFRFYKEKTLCDFTLKVGDDTFNVHKIVLSAASPVFAAMFTNEMSEKKHNIVDIVDLDKETVEQMIYFIYTGSVKELEYESAKKLFIAGDKYGIQPLLDLARDFMIGLIKSDVVCDILIFADTHNDKELQKEAVTFIRFNKVTVLQSPKWSDFEKEYGNLAAKILKQVCLLNKRKRL